MSHISQIAVVERHALVRRGLVSLLESSPLVQLVAVAADCTELRSRTLGRRLDVVVYGAPAQTRLSLAEAVSALSAQGRVLVVAEFAGWQPVSDALRAGAFGCVSKEADEEELLRAVQTVAQGGLHVAAALADRLHEELRQPSAASLPALPQREMEALRWLATGLTHSQIARRMNLTEATVSTYVKRVRNRLNVGNKADLTRKAIELGLLGDEPPGAADRITHFPPAA
jgi:DNA-binding NarL/FixJ family response regulator